MDISIFLFLSLAMVFVLVSYAIKLHDIRVTKDMWNKRTLEQFKANTERSALHIHAMSAEATLMREKRLLSSDTTTPE